MHLFRAALLPTTIAALIPAAFCASTNATTCGHPPVNATTNATMSVSFTVLYPQGAVFDFDYYVNNHMPRAARTFGPVLQKWEVFRLAADAPYGVQAQMTFRSAEESAAVWQTEEGIQLREDRKNYSSVEPLGMQCTFVAGGP